jgi:hypothetical protein
MKKKYMKKLSKELIVVRKHKKYIWKIWIIEWIVFELYTNEHKTHMVYYYCSYDATAWVIVLCISNTDGSTFLTENVTSFSSVASIWITLNPKHNLRILRWYDSFHFWFLSFSSDAIIQIEVIDFFLGDFLFGLTGKQGAFLPCMVVLVSMSSIKARWKLYLQVQKSWWSSTKKC